MPTQRRQTQKGNSSSTSSQQIEILEQKYNKVLSHKRGEASPIDESLVASRQLDLLKSDHSLQPRCSMYGLLRQTKFPDHFFCAGCDNWDKSAHENKRLKPSMNNASVQLGIPVLYVPPH